MSTINLHEIIDKFIIKFKEKHNNKTIDIEGILLFGSSVNPEKMDKNSDIDLYIVIKNIGKRYRGVAKVGDVEIDYFINPIEQLRVDLDTAKSTFKKTVLFMLADGKIMQDKNDQLLNLKNEAKNHLENEINKNIPNFQIIFMKYFIDDYLKDIEDCYDKKDWFSLQYNLNHLSNYLIEVFCNTQGILMSKPKHQKNEIAVKDKIFVELYKATEKSATREEKIQTVKDLSNYVLNKLGGKLPEKWEMESDVVERGY